jgi:hypothetical protein
MENQLQMGFLMLQKWYISTRSGRVSMILGHGQVCGL